jgi:hypothetical protein
MAVNVTMSHSQCLDQEHEKEADTLPKTIEQLVPQYLLPYKEVFLQGKLVQNHNPGKLVQNHNHLTTRSNSKRDSYHGTARSTH